VAFTGQLAAAGPADPRVRQLELEFTSCRAGLYAALLAEVSAGPGHSSAEAAQLRVLLAGTSGDTGWGGRGLYTGLAHVLRSRGCSPYG
jgi:hypothetical protein